MSESMLKVDTSQEILNNNSTSNEEVDEIRQNHINELKNIISEKYPNKEHFNVKEIIHVLKLFHERNIIELKSKDLEDSMETFANDNNSELQEVSLDDICNMILSFITEGSKSANDSIYSDNFENVNQNLMDETNEAFRIPSISDSNQNDSNDNNFNDNNFEDNSNIEDDIIDNEYFNVNSKIIGNNNINNKELITSIINPSETSTNENSKYIYESYAKDNTIPYTSSSDNVKIVKLDKPSLSENTNFSQLFESFITDNILKDPSKEKSKNSSRKSSSGQKNLQDDYLDFITDGSSIKLESDTGKGVNEFFYIIRQRLDTSLSNCKKLCEDIRQRDQIIKNLKIEMEALKKENDDNTKKLTKSERELNIVKQREASLLENIKEYTTKEMEREKSESTLKIKITKLEKQYNSQQYELNKIHEKSERHLNELRKKEEELKIANEEIDKCRDGKKIDEKKMLEMDKRLKEYEKQFKSIPIEIDEEVKNNDIKWQQMLKEQNEIFEEQYLKLKNEILQKDKEEEELQKKNNELLLQINELSNQINDLKAERELELSQSLDGSFGMSKNLNVELNNALAMDQEKDKKIEENQEKIKTLMEKCGILENEIENIKNEKNELIEKEKKWNQEKQENMILIADYLEPTLNQYKNNEIILRGTIEDLNKEIVELKAKIKSNEQLDTGNNQVNLITGVITDAVQTCDDMKGTFNQLEKGIQDIDKLNNELIDEKLKPPPKFNTNNNINDESFDPSISIDQSELILADANNLESDVPVISCNISLAEEDSKRLNDNNNKKSNSNEDNNKNSNKLFKINEEEPLESNEVNGEPLPELNDENKEKNIDKIDEAQHDINEDIKNNVMITKESNDDEINQINKLDVIPNEKGNSLINQENILEGKKSSNLNIPILDQLDQKIINDDENNDLIDTQKQELDTKLINQSSESKRLDITVPSSASSNYKQNKATGVYSSKNKRYNPKTVLSFIGLQSFIIFATATSVILTIEKMLGIRIIMKFVDTYLEDEKFIKEEGSPS